MTASTMLQRIQLVLSGFVDRGAAD
jgi:hypothetical protein